jgi:hypothetical protein
MEIEDMPNVSVPLEPAAVNTSLPPLEAVTDIDGELKFD